MYSCGGPCIAVYTKYLPRGGGGGGGGGAFEALSIQPSS